MRYSANLAGRDRLGEAMREHEPIVDALRRRAGSELGDMMFVHLRKSGRRLRISARHGMTAAAESRRMHILADDEYIIK